MRITESQLRKIVREEILRESVNDVTDDELIKALSRLNPFTDVAITTVGPPRGEARNFRLKSFIPNARKMIISHLNTAPRKWVLMQWSKEGRDWRDADYNPYVPLKTGTFDPVNYRMTTDPEIDMAAVKFVDLTE